VTDRTRAGERRRASLCMSGRTEPQKGVTATETRNVLPKREMRGGPLATAGGGSSSRTGYVLQQKKYLNSFDRPGYFVGETTIDLTIGGSDIPI